MLKRFMLSDRLVAVNIPDNHGELIRRKNQLEIEILALKSRLADATTHGQRISIGHDLGKANQELKLVNKRLKTFNPPKSVKQKFKERQVTLREMGLDLFPENGTAEERYTWALGALHHAMDCLDEHNVQDGRVKQVLSSVAAADYWERLKIVEANEAEKHWRINAAQSG